AAVATGDPGLHRLRTRIQLAQHIAIEGADVTVHAATVAEVVLVAAQEGGLDHVHRLARAQLDDPGSQAADIGRAAEEAGVPTFHGGGRMRRIRRLRVVGAQTQSGDRSESQKASHGYLRVEDGWL